MGLFPTVRKGDWTQNKKNWQKAGSIVFGERSEQTFANLTLTGLTASQLVQTDANKQLASVSDLTAWILQGSANQVRVNDEGDGTVTLSLPQDYHTSATPTLAQLTLSTTCTLAAGLNVLRVTGLQTDGTAMTGTLRGAYIDVSNGSTAATGTIRGMELKARTEAPGDTGNNVTTLEGLSISADSKGHSVTTMRAAEFILDGAAGGTITEAVGLRIANNLQVNKATTSYGLQIYRDSFDYTADIQLSSGGLIGGTNGHLTIDNSGNVILTSLTAGRVLFAGTGGVVDDDAACLWDDVNKRLGIGVTPLARFHIKGVSVNTDLFRLEQSNGNRLMNVRDSGFAALLALYDGASATILLDANSNCYFSTGGNYGFGEASPETLTEWTHAQPYLTLHNSTHEDGNGGRESRLIFKGEQSGGEEKTLAKIEAGHDGTGDDEKGYFDIFINDGNDGDSPTKRLRIDSIGALNVWGVIQPLSTGNLAFDLNDDGSAFHFRNVANDALVTIRGIGNVGIQQATPTARLHLPAGTATASTAPLKFTSGTDLTAPEAGTIEYDGKHYSVTEVVDRRVLSVASDSVTTAVTAANTTDETTVFTASISANELHVGKVLRVWGCGQISTHDANDTLTVRIKIGGTLLTTLDSTPKTVTGKPMHFWNLITIRTTGAAGTLASHGFIMIEDTEVHDNDQDVAIDTTAADDITVTFQWDDADAGNIAVLDQCFLEILV